MCRVHLHLSRPFVWAGLILASFGSALFGQTIPTEVNNGRLVASSQVLVQFRTVTAATIPMAQLLADADFIRPISPSLNIHLIHSRSKNLIALLAALASHTDALYVGPDHILHAVAIPNDPSFSSLWGLQNGSVPGADISAVSAWDISTGSTTHVIGVVDTGIDYTHPDLAANVWSAPSSFTVTVGGANVTCAAGTHGFNAITNTCDPKDDHNHGTHVSGTIGAVGNNAAGVVGVNWTTRIMGLKFLSAAGSGTTSDAIKAIEFAIQVRALFPNSADVRVLSNSWGGDTYDPPLLAEINKANDNNMLFVVAAGNSARNLDTSADYPVSYNTPNMIGVAATDSTDALASFSNYSSHTVHLGAPGVGIYSTIIGGYGSLSGTSMATPHVAGAVMLLLSTCALNTAALKTLILGNVDPVPALAGKTITGGRLNVNRAIRACAAAPAYTVSATPSSVAAGGTITVNWSAAVGHSPTDWIGLYATGASSSQHLWWANTGAATSGTLSLSAPATAGTYEFRYLLNNGYTDAARSGTLTITSAGPLISNVSTAGIAPSFANINWMTDVPADSQVEYSADMSYALLSPLNTALVTSHAMSLSGLAPSTTYHFRVKSRNASGILATSGDNTFTTSSIGVDHTLNASPASVPSGGSITVNWSAPAGSSPYDWVALFPTGSSSFLWWQYTGGATSGSVSVSAPATAGTYEFRYMLNNGYTDVARSNTVIVTGGPSFTLTASPSSIGVGGTLTVSWTTPAGRPNTDWIGLYATGTSNSQYLWWTYTGGSTSGSVMVTAPSTTGTYEFRYLLDNGFSDAVRTNSVTVH